MPRISEGTVREHREKVRAQLIEAAEQILRTRGSAGLTAAEVTAAAGIARNSIYRYVDSVDDLRGLVLERHLPSWMSAVAHAVAEESDPRQRILTWCSANLEQASTSGHGWLMDLARGSAIRGGTKDAVRNAHRSTEDELLVMWRAVDPGRAPICTELTRSIVDGGFRCLDRGQPLVEVVDAAHTAVRALLGPASVG